MLPNSGPMQGGFNWGQFLASVGAGLSAAGAPGGGLSAFAPAVAQAQQGYQANAMDRRRFQLAEQEAQRQQDQWEAQQRTANQEAAEKDRQLKLWADFIGNGPMAPQPDVATASAPGALPPGPMQMPVTPHGNYGAATGGLMVQDGRAAAKTLGNLPSGLGDRSGGIEGTASEPAQSGGFNPTPQQRQLLALLGPEEGMKLYAQLAFAQPKDTGTDDMREYALYRQQGGTDDFTTWLRGNKQASRSVTSVNMPGNPTPDERGRGAFAEANAKAQAQYFDNVATAGAQANQRLGDINQLIALMEVTPQGAGQEWLNKGAAIASRFGIDAGEYANVPAAQAFQSIVSRIAPTLRVQGSGATSDFEMRQFLQSLPAIANMPDGNRIIASNLKKISERSVQEAYIANQVQGGDLTPAQGRKKILDLGPLDLDLPHFSNTPPAGGPGGAPDNGVGGTGVRYEDNLPEGFN